MAFTLVGITVAAIVAIAAMACTVWKVVQTVNSIFADCDNDVQ